MRINRIKPIMDSIRSRSLRIRIASSRVVRRTCLRIRGNRRHIWWSW